MQIAFRVTSSQRRWTMIRFKVCLKRPQSTINSSNYLHSYTKPTISSGHPLRRAWRPRPQPRARSNLGASLLDAVPPTHRPRLDRHYNEAGPAQPPPLCRRHDRRRQLLPGRLRNRPRRDRRPCQGRALRRRGEQFCGPAAWAADVDAATYKRSGRLERRCDGAVELGVGEHASGGVFDAGWGLRC
jgi:hypothetical protein